MSLFSCSSDDSTTEENTITEEGTTTEVDVIVIDEHGETIRYISDREGCEGAIHEPLCTMFIRIV